MKKKSQDLYQKLNPNSAWAWPFKDIARTLTGLFNSEQKNDELALKYYPPSLNISVLTDASFPEKLSLVFRRSIENKLNARKQFLKFVDFLSRHIAPRKVIFNSIGDFRQITLTPQEVIACLQPPSAVDIEDSGYEADDEDEALETPSLVWPQKPQVGSTLAEERKASLRTSTSSGEEGGEAKLPTWSSGLRDGLDKSKWSWCQALLGCIRFVFWKVPRAIFSCFSCCCCRSKLPHDDRESSSDRGPRVFTSSFPVHSDTPASNNQTTADASGNRAYHFPCPPSSKEVAASRSFTTP